MPTPDDVLKLVPEAVAWAEGLQERANESGRPLSEALQRLAKTVGVQQPELVRLVLTDRIPLPEDPRLHEAALHLGFLGPDSIGLTLGHAVFVKEIFFDLRVLAHECRHVFQYEQAGSMAAYLSGYIAAALEFGYFLSPYEQDARSVESLAAAETPAP